MDDSLHIWMSLYDWVCMRGCGWQVTANPIIDSLQKTISDLVNTCRGLVVVCVIAPSNAFVCELEETCISPTFFNIPKNMEESKVKFARNADEQVEGARVKLKMQSHFLRELLRELNADTNGVVRSTEGRKLYTRPFAECVVAIPDLQHLTVSVNNVQAMTTILRELAYSKLKKELSHVGFVSMTMDQAAQFYNNGHGKQLCASRDVIT